VVEASDKPRSFESYRAFISELVRVINSMTLIDTNLLRRLLPAYLVWPPRESGMSTYQAALAGLGNNTPVAAFDPAYITRVTSAIYAVPKGEVPERCWNKLWAKLGMYLEVPFKLEPENGLRARVQARQLSLVQEFMEPGLPEFGSDADILGQIIMRFVAYYAWESGVEAGHEKGINMFSIANYALETMPTHPSDSVSHGSYIGRNEYAPAALLMVAAGPVEGRVQLSFEARTRITRIEDDRALVKQLLDEASSGPDSGSCVEWVSKTLGLRQGTVPQLCGHALGQGPARPPHAPL
jgi:hypothetical protein